MTEGFSVIGSGKGFTAQTFKEMEDLKYSCSMCRILNMQMRNDRECHIGALADI